MCICVRVCVCDILILNEQTYKRTKNNVFVNTLYFIYYNYLAIFIIYFYFNQVPVSLVLLYLYPEFVLWNGTMKYWNMVIKFFDQVIFTAIYIITVIKLKYSGQLASAESSVPVLGAGVPILICNIWQQYLVVSSKFVL